MNTCEVCGKQWKAMHVCGGPKTPPQSSREKQEAFRARMAMLGLREVRGIYLPPEMHQQLKQAAQALLQKEKE